MSLWPMMYCSAFGFMPAFAISVQNVWRSVCGVMSSGRRRRPRWSAPLHPTWACGPCGHASDAAPSRPSASLPFRIVGTAPVRDCGHAAERIGEQEHERHRRHGTESPLRASQRPCERCYGDELHGEDERDHIAHEAHRDLIRPCHPAPPST